MAVANITNMKNIGKIWGTQYNVGKLLYEDRILSKNIQLETRHIVGIIYLHFVLNHNPVESKSILKYMI